MIDLDMIDLGDNRRLRIQGNDSGVIFFDMLVDGDDGTYSNITKDHAIKVINALLGAIDFDERVVTKTETTTTYSIK